MTVRSASHPSGPSLVVGVSSVHGVSRPAAASTSRAVSMPSTVANAAARSPGCSGGRRPQRGPRSPPRVAASSVRSLAQSASCSAPGWPARWSRSVVRWRRSVRYAAGFAACPRTGTCCPARAALTRTSRARTSSLAGFPRDGGEVVLALPGRACTERVPAHSGGANATQVGGGAGRGKAAGRTGTGRPAEIRVLCRWRR